MIFQLHMHTHTTCHAPSTNISSTMCTKIDKYSKICIYHDGHGILWLHHVDWLTQYWSNSSALAVTAVLELLQSWVNALMSSNLSSEPLIHHHYTPPPLPIICTNVTTWFVVCLMNPFTNQCCVFVKWPIETNFSQISITLLKVVW